MDISGTQKIKASQEQVFHALLTPDVLKNSVPGCESAEYVEIDGIRQLKLVISTSIPGLKGPYNIYLLTREAVEPSRLVVFAEPYNDMGTIKVECAMDLTPDPVGTKLDYTSSAEMTGKIASMPEFVAKPTIKSMLDKFFSNLEKQVSAS
jgi:uncharacterized protein